MIVHEHRLRIYYGDTDAGGVMYHAAYLNFAERARTEALRESGLPHTEMQAEHGVVFMVRRLEIEYFRPLLLDDEAVIRTVSEDCSAATVTLRQVFSGAGAEGSAEAAVARVVLACVRVSDGRAARIPARWRAALAIR